MRLGITLPHVGHAASTDAISTTARWAEADGYDSLWVVDRCLAAESPRSPIPGTVDPTPPDEMRVSFDPILSLAVAATEHVVDPPGNERARRLRGTRRSCSPARLTTLDHVSGGG